nr:hypothetical protein BaRGS_023371 [Batillaria attramentaria]
MSLLSQVAFVHMDEVQARLRIFDAELHGLRQNDETLSSELEQRSKTDEALKSDVTRIQSELEQRHNVDVDLQTQLDVQRDVNSDLTAKDDSLASDIDVLRTELSRQSDADDALVSDVAEIRQKLDQREEEHRHLKGRVENLTKVNGALEDRLKSQESEYATLKTDVTQLSARLQQLADGYEQLRDQLTQQQTKQGKRVAFLARFGDNEQIKVSPPTKVVFNKLVFNIGGGFDPSTGVFTAPFAGVYVFNFQIYPSAGGLVQVDLMKNDGIEKRTKDFDGSVTLRVQAGDRFWVRDRMSPGSTLWGGVHTFFSGTLVSADE